MEIRDGRLVGTAFFSDEAGRQWNLVRDGHLTDFSIGYRTDPSESVFVRAGKTENVDGREWEGPVLLQRKWHVKELSLVPIGADEMAKARAEAGYPLKGKSMNDKLKAALIARGLPADATDDQAIAFLDTLPARQETKPDDKPADVDVDKIRREATGAERERIADIDALCKRHELTDLAGRMISDGLSIEKARAQVLDAIVERERAEGHPATSPGIVTHDARDKFRSAAVDAILIRGGVSVETPDAGADDLTGYSLREIARESLRIANRSDRGNPMEMVGRALETTDLPDLLGAVANRSLFAGFETAEETWSRWCGIGSTPDFNTRYLVNFGEMDDLAEVKEGQPYTYGSAASAKESYQIATYGKMFAVTRQSIVNDELGVLTTVPAGHGESAARQLGDIAYSVLTSNPNMADGTALFAAGHANIADGNVGAPSVAAMDEAFYDMRIQTDIRGLRRLNIRPRYLIAPVSLEATVKKFFATELIPPTINLDDSTSSGGQANIYYGGAGLEIVTDPRLDDDSATAWYLAGRQGKTVTMFFLNGMRSPYLETRPGWNVDGVEYKVRIYAGAAAVAYQALWKNAGA
jgi:hypothetical protein